jgi:hypothetical protein
MRIHQTNQVVVRRSSAPYLAVAAVGLIVAAVLVPAVLTVLKILIAVAALLPLAGALAAWQYHRSRRKIGHTPQKTTALPQTTQDDSASVQLQMGQFTLDELAALRELAAAINARKAEQLAPRAADQAHLRHRDEGQP